MKNRVILSVGMPRAGSGWYYNLTHSLIVASGGQESRQIRKQYRLARYLTEVNCNIGTLSPHRLIPVMIPALLGNTYTIKLHAGPSAMASWLIQKGWIRPTYIYRDPRDALLSAFEYGQRKRKTGRRGPFSELVTIDKAIDFMLKYIQISDAWLACENALHVRYEDLLLNYDVEAARLIKFFTINQYDPTIMNVIDRYRPNQGDSKKKGTHFVKGKIGRYREALTSEQQARCVDVFGPYLERMKFPIA
jgi:hypothetical protein